MTTQPIAQPIALETGLNEYEMVYVLNPTLADEALEKAVENVSNMITSRGGTVTTTDRWGKRRLAYPLNHFNEGNYCVAHFQLAPARNREVDNSLKITEDVLRHLIVKID